jgi:PilZ domain
MNEAQGNKRRASRRRVLKAGIITFNDRHSALPCTVRDLSDTGARLAVTASVSAPDRFDLIIELDGLEAPCEVVRRNGSDIAVRFLTVPRFVKPKRSQVVNPLVPAQTPSLRRKPKPGST